MEYSGALGKMSAHHAEPVQYHLLMGKEKVDMNALIGQHINIKFEGSIHCIVCGRKTSKAFGQGFCIPCFMNAPENSECIIRPELCEGHLGKGRDPEWENRHHVAPHYVYLALTSAVKVGVTRDGNIPNRWMNQGAWKVILFAETPYRRLAGEIEVFMKDHLSDKTNWQKMLKGINEESVDLLEEKNRLLDLLPKELGQYYSGNDEVLEFNYPVAEYPQKIKSLNLDKTPEIEGILQGIRGQYLYFDGGQVMNVRKFSGYDVVLTV